jgi:hypothetical protein
LWVPVLWVKVAAVFLFIEGCLGWGVSSLQWQDYSLILTV